MTLTEKEKSDRAPKRTFEKRRRRFRSLLAIVPALIGAGCTVRPPPSESTTDAQLTQATEIVTETPEPAVTPTIQPMTEVEIEVFLGGGPGDQFENLSEIEIQQYVDRVTAKLRESEARMREYVSNYPEAISPDLDHFQQELFMTADGEVFVSYQVVYENDSRGVHFFFPLDAGSQAQGPDIFARIEINEQGDLIGYPPASQSLQEVLIHSPRQPSVEPATVTPEVEETPVVTTTTPITGTPVVTTITPIAETPVVTETEAQQPEGNYTLLSVPLTRNLSIRVYVDQTNSEFSDPTELERFVQFRDFLPELLEIRGELAFRVKEYLGVNFGEADLQKMHLSLNRNGSNFELILHDARTGEDQEINLGTISADENFIYIDVGNGPEQMAQHPREYKTTYAGAEFTMRHVAYWPEQLATIDLTLAIEYFMRSIMHNPDMWQHLGAEKPFESPEEVVEFYLQQQAEGKELLVPISISSGEPGKYNEVHLAPGNPFEIDSWTFMGIDKEQLNLQHRSTTFAVGIRTWIDVVNGKWSIFYATQTSTFATTPLDGKEAKEAVIASIGPFSTIIDTPVGKSSPNLPTIADYPDLLDIWMNKNLVVRKFP